MNPAADLVKAARHLEALVQRRRVARARVRTLDADVREARRLVDMLRQAINPLDVQPGSGGGHAVAAAVYGRGAQETEAAP